MEKTPTSQEKEELILERLKIDTTISAADLKWWSKLRFSIYLAVGSSEPFIADA